MTPEQKLAEIKTTVDAALEMTTDETDYARGLRDAYTGVQKIIDGGDQQ